MGNHRRRHSVATGQIRFHLEGANLIGAQLKGATPYGTHLEGANLGAATGLSGAQLADAHGDAAKRLRYRITYSVFRLAAQEPAAFHRYLAPTYHVEWVVYAKPPFAGPAQVLEYVGRYTHRVAISNNRLVSIKDGKVQFRWKDYRQGNRQKVMTLDSGEFIRRFLIHGCRTDRIRYYGFLSNCHRSRKLAQCRALLGMASVEPLPANERRRRGAGSAV